MTQGEITIPIDNINTDFLSFIDKENNNKIFFSGNYGVGKTYFLDNFFLGNSEYFEAFHLFPINYQIQDNNLNVLELLKYDILIELLNKADNTIFTEDDNDAGMIGYIKENFNTNNFLAGTVSSFIEPIPQIGGLLGRPLQSLLSFDKKLQKFKEGDAGKINDFLEKTKEEIILETDYISHILNKKISKLKNKKKSVLILDDLDRLDPEHIFRILNIFASFYEQNHVNKFGFDKIILVGDYNNLRHIFHHRYGERTDFSGYIDKFYSTDPYYFDNSKAIISIVDEIISAVRVSDDKLESALGDSGYIRYILKYFFVQSTKNNSINLRKLLKSTRNQVRALEEGKYFSGPFAENKKENIFNISLDLLHSIFGNLDELIAVSEKIFESKSVGGKMRHMPFEFYIEIMLKVLGIELKNDEEDSFMKASRRKGYSFKNQYKVTLKKQSFFDIEVSMGDKEKMFLELLLVYLKRKEYIKSYDEYNS